MKSKKSILTTIVVVACIIGAIIFGFSQCSDGPIKIESESLIVDSTCYIGNYNCPKLKVKVRNDSNSTYTVYIDVNFYYKGELASSESSSSERLSAGDSFTFVIQSYVGTYFVIDQDNWTYKITEIHYY